MRVESLVLVLCLPTRVFFCRSSRSRGAICISHDVPRTRLHCLARMRKLFLVELHNAENLSDT